MPLIKSVDASERKSHAMQRYRNVAAYRIEIAQRRPSAHVIFRMDLHPRNVGTRVEHRLMMLKAQPNPGFRRDQAAPADVCRTHQVLAVKVEVVLPPWILPQSPAGRRTNEFAAPACVALPAHQCAPSAQSFLETAFMPKHFSNFSFAMPR